MTTVEQIEQSARIPCEFGREIANGKEGRRICRIDEFYKSAEETLSRNSFASNRVATRRFRQATE